MSANRMIESLASVCRERPLEEKWLVAPSLRIGRQWLDAAARRGAPVVNARVKTLKSMALEIAGPELARRGVAPVAAQAAELIADGVWNGLRTRFKGGYLSDMKPGMELSGAIYSTLNALRLAGVAASDLDPGRFEVELKAKELAAAMNEYLKELERLKYVDYAWVLEAAAEAVSKSLEESLRGAVTLIPADIEPNAMEKKLLEAIPAGAKIILEGDKPCVEAGAVECKTDLGLLAYSGEPGAAPAPFGDGSVKIFRAAGAVNEVREVVRRCLADGIHFDEVELLHTNTDIYVRLIYEISEKHRVGGAGELPVTFAEGVPVNYSRPGRALAGWLDWIAQGYPQKLLVSMIHDGLLEIPEVMAGETRYAGLSATLRSVRIGLGGERTIELLREEAAATEKRLTAPPADEEPPDPEKRRVALERRLKELRILAALAERLLDTAPIPADPDPVKLKKAERFLLEHARAVSELDTFSRVRMLAVIDEMRALLEASEGAHSLEVWEWLRGLPGSLRVLGSGPRPGHIHVDSVYSGGHSGRAHTFIIGLDDSLFPGGMTQDPLLLDAERRRISPNLECSAERVEKKLAGFARLAARLRGCLTLAFSCRDLLDDREMFSASVLIDAYRIVSGDRSGDQSGLDAWLAAPASFAPASDAGCLDATECMMRLLLGDVKVENVAELVLNRYPHLGRGLAAESARDGAEFTEYDGLAPRAGADRDPFDPDGPVMSASRLEKIGACPLSYFFKYILKIEPPEDIEVDPYEWLGPLETGSLMHSVFESFFKKIAGMNRPPAPDDRILLNRILDSHVEEYRRLYPPPSEAVFSSHYEKLKRMAWIFLVEEIKLAPNSRPVYMEASIGMPPAPGSDGTPIDSPDPVLLRLPGGGVRVRGRIDRIDEHPAQRGRLFSIWDYKTGGTYKYSGADAFRQGRVVQHALYLEMLAPVIRRAHGPEALIGGFGYFFPSPKAGGERISWQPEELEGGLDVIARLCRIAAAGCFSATDNADDCKYCDYAPVCGDVEATAAAAAQKLDNPGNSALAPFRELRRNG